MAIGVPVVAAFRDRIVASPNFVRTILIFAVEHDHVVHLIDADDLPVGFMYALLGNRNCQM